MAAQKGSDLLVKIGNAGSPETFTTVGGLRDTSISMSNETIDITTKDSSRVRTLLAGAGTQTFSVSGSGVFTDSASEASVRTAFAAATFSNFQVIVPDFGTFTGSMAVTSLEYSGNFNGEVAYSVALESAGAITFATV